VAQDVGFHFFPYWLDPTGANYAGLNPILSDLVTRSLTQYVYDPETGTMVLIPDIATDLGTPNDDFTEWTYTIRPGVKFEDGSAVTADDVAYGIKRSLDRKAFGAGPNISNRYFLHGHTYHGVYHTGSDYDGVVVDGDTLTIKMARPFPDMPYWAASPAMGPIPEDGSNPSTYYRHPLATGPYKFDGEWSPWKPLTLVRNDEWDPDTDPGRHQYPDRWVFPFDVSDRAAAAAILGDSADGETSVSFAGVSGEDYATASSLDRVTAGPLSSTALWEIDCRRVTDVRVRKAIGDAYPYAAVADIRDRPPSLTTLGGTSLFPPGFPGRRDYDPLDIAPGQTDPDKARALLRQAGYGPGEYELRWAYAADDVARTKAMVAAFDEAGFRANPFRAGDSDAAYAVNVDTSAPMDLRYTSFLLKDWRAGDAWIPPYFQSGADYNLGSFSEPAVDDEIRRIDGLPFNEQPAAWGALDETMMTEYYPAVVTAYDAVAHLHGSRIGGMNISDVDGSPTLQDIYVIPSVRG
jgi:peptide/nickel transport system substrate-binding protein